MKSQPYFYAAAFIATLLLTTGFAMLATLPPSPSQGGLWLGLAVAVFVFAAIPGARLWVVQWAPTYLAWPWLWLALVVLAGVGVLFVGHEANGAMRHYGALLQVRSGLWAVIFHTVFLILLAQQGSVPRWGYGLALAGTGLLGLALLAQPDYFSVLMLSASCLWVVVWAKNRLLRIGLIVAVGAGVALLTAAVVSSPYRFQRLLAQFNPTQDPYGFGFEARTLAKATEQAGWFGFQGDWSASAMARLPNSLEWYSLNYLGLWLGHGSVLALALLFAFAFLIYRLSRQIGSDTQRLIVQGGLLV
ncbi:MAG: FtsW/RodA/SpoVE family cell cycle protein, partial [Hydrogenophaga sp.]|nr:FtsW/RodA/SpoVE family cell cycle protein [Hydrogenophaga sp.]